MDLGLPLAQADADFVIRELTSHEVGAPAARSSLSKISERHHALARALAAGMTTVQCSEITGYSPGTIRALQNDPSVKELVAGYRAIKTEDVRDLNSRLIGLAKDAIDELRTRIEEKPAEIGTSALMELAKMGADRTGFGPSASISGGGANINIAVRLEAARKRQTVTVIDNEVEDVNQA